jgi:hypothetical protein
LRVIAADLDIERVDDAVERAIAAGEPGVLRVLGYGEVTLVLGWPSDEPEVAVKRLPAFPGRAAVERYGDLLRRYVAVLEERGVRTISTELLPAGSGTSVRPYLVQPLVRGDRLLPEVLRAADPERAALLLGRLAGAVAAAIDENVGMDAQPSNWVVGDDDELTQLDLSTPMLRTAAGRHELDVGVFISIYPWILRGPLRPVAASVMSAYFDRRTVLLDIAGNLTREGLGQRVPAFLEAANKHLPKPIAEDEVRKYVTRDKLLWQTMQRLRRLDRAWQKRVRRRPYPFLLPPPYRYGPQQLP